ncbi:MAG TPA: 2-methylfumaryl-CoA isomerase [Acidimicrobiaceae bacterium]|jgi:2-methylfumaryl-CoA isomerase|nr:CoA transferase [Acidimicrobiales bacterium]HAA67404.1 2-methylfumaryl-CoA isomerase [Acidimicrobiaceae bacterium]HAY65028.1 2-methylfumaryl-CoA isomerase [Acidimicrobiaceae bacterium]HBV24435.1 2-methylfumaryl-CoA isomerase [Acidimicrobiaceae bacterium]HCK74104.1 2-methylfumaryl-CoA isomerase [Acidimicrobiaceae bacterium]|tara:strand:+ start:2436 stop:3656 length:1221 start_codon:yes stop_codon:yes gene_type:complete
MTPVLEGLRVVEGSAFVAAPLGGMTLAQLGAEVIRFDAIGGGLDYQRWPVTEEGVSLFWAGLNKGKKSIQVDLRSEAGREIITQLITQPGPDNGIFLSNFPESSWLSYERLRQERDDLIYVNIIGNPDASTAVDYTVNPSSGFAMATGPIGSNMPTNHVLPAWDTATGLTAALGLLAAERYRHRTGIGQLSKISLTDVAFAMVANLGYMAQAQLTKEDRVPVGNDLYGAFGRDFATKDDRRIMVVAISKRQWQSLVEATDIVEHLPAIEKALGVDLSKEGDRWDARDAIASFMAPFIEDHTLEEIAETFDAKGVCWGPYQTFTQLVNEDRRATVNNPMFDKIDQPGVGRILAPGSPLSFSEIDRGQPTVAPRLGEHTDEILLEMLSMTSTEVGKLHDNGVVAGPQS